MCHIAQAKGHPDIDYAIDGVGRRGWTPQGGGMDLEECGRVAVGCRLAIVSMLSWRSRIWGWKLNLAYNMLCVAVSVTC